MAYETDDVAKKQDAGAETASAPDLPSPDSVEAFLRTHPSFLADRPELVERLDMPARFGGPGIVDFQQAMVANLRRRLDEHETRHNDLIAISRANLSVQARVHDAVLAVLGARTFEHLIEIVTTDLALSLDVDVATICVEGEAENFPQTNAAGVHILAPGTVDRLLGPGRDSLLQKRLHGEPALFGPGACLVESGAFLRLNVSPITPPGLLCLGARTEGKFHNGQGTELLLFLARVVERAIGAWLDLPPR